MPNRPIGFQIFDQGCGLHHLGRPLWYRLRAWWHRETRTEGSPYPICIVGEVDGTVAFVPRFQVLEQMREVHRRAVLEIAIRPLVSETRNALHISNHPRAER